MAKRYWFILGILLLSIVFVLIFVLLSKLRTQNQDVRSQAQGLLQSPKSTPALFPNATPSILTATEPSPTATPLVLPIQKVLTTAQAATFTLSGTVFIDADGDSLWDLDESGFDSATVTLVGGGTHTTTTSTTGRYTFSGLSAGSYTVLLTIPSGYMVTTNSLTNLYLTADRRHHIGVELIPTTSTPGSTSTSTPTPTPVPTPTPTPTPNPNQAQYYVSPTGSDSADGSQSTPYLTIQRAVTVSKSDLLPGAVIHVLPGTYRESVALTAVSGTSSAPVEIKAENGPETVFVLGSESSQDSRITWAQADGGISFPSGVSSHIYRADVSVWNATPELAYDNDSTPERLPKAHEPDFGVTTAWKYHQNWWKADGKTISTLDTLIDATNDIPGSYPEAAASAGNLGSINGFTSDFLAGARIFLKDTYDGHDSLTATISAHTASTGTIQFSSAVTYYDGTAAAGQYAKYYIEGKPQLLDTAGEWYYDSATHYLYIWPPGDTNPNTQDLEFAVRNTAFSINRGVYITLKDLNLQFTNHAYSGVTGPDGAVRFFGFSTDISNHITLDGLHVAYNGIGLRLYQSNALSSSIGMLSYVTVQNSTIEDADGYGMVVWPFPRTAPQNPPINHIWLENNEFGHLGFRWDGEGILMQYPEKIVAINNYVHDTGHNGFHIQQGKMTGDSYVYIANNLFDANCYNGSDCGGMKLSDATNGTGSNTNFVSHNIFRGTKGWSYASEVQNQHNSPSGYGYYGFGYYSDVELNTDPLLGCGIILFRNISQNNSADGVHFTRSRDQCVFNTLFTQNGTGIQMNNYAPTTDGSFGNILRGNIFHFTEGTNSTAANIYGVNSHIDQADEGQMEVNRNIYQMSGTHAFDMYKQDIGNTHIGTFTTVGQIQSNTPWEDNGSDVTGGTVGLTTEDHYDISSIESTFGISSVTVPAEASTTINALQTEYGITISNGTNVGRIP
ncbi:MAG: SdrD B-like domain-containing protein [Candidatus Woesebacteria bacterium]